MESFGGDVTVLYPDLSGSYTNLYMRQNYIGVYTKKSTLKTDEKK